MITILVDGFLGGLWTVQHTSMRIDIVREGGLPAAFTYRELLG